MSRRYLEYTEASCFGLIREQYDFSEEQLIERITSIVKLYAIFGGQLTIGSISPLGSHPILDLFADSSFRSFIEKHPGFLELGSATPQESGRYEQVTDGLRRALRPGWISTGPIPTDLATELAKRMLDVPEDSFQASQMLSDNRPGSVRNFIRKNRLYGRQMRGVVYAFSHFANQRDAPLAVSKVSPTIYDLLIETRNRPSLSMLHKDQLDKSLEFIRTYHEQPNEVPYSAIIQSVITHAVNEAQRKTLLQTTSHAYNATLVKALDPEYGSYAFYSDGAPIGLYLDSLRDVLVPGLNVPGSRTPLYRILNLVRFPWGPSSLTWKEILEVQDDDGAFATGGEFQASMESSDDNVVENAAKAHIKSISRIVPPSRLTVQRPWSWVIGGVGIVIGLVSDTPLVTQVSAGTIIATDAVADAIYAGRRYIAAETYRDSARRMRLRPQIMDESTSPF